MSGRAEDRSTPDRLAYLWNHRNALNKAEMAEFYQLLTGHVWTRVNVRSICDTLLIEPRDARHDCFIAKILGPARGSRSGSGKAIEPDSIVAYLVRILQNYLQDQLRRQRVDRGSGNTVVNLTEEEWGSLVDDRVPGAEEVSNPLLTAEFERRLHNDVLPQARQFVQQLEHADLVLLKCWYANNPQPALYWFSRIVKNPDYRARRLGLNPCSREFLDYGKTRIGKWAADMGLNLARDRYAEIHAILEKITAVALSEQTVDCAELDIGPPASPRGDGQRPD
jgi:DNA-directed RNA polymerase specialized sigma24 family protein